MTRSGSISFFLLSLVLANGCGSGGNGDGGQGTTCGDTCGDTGDASARGATSVATPGTSGDTSQGTSSTGEPTFTCEETPFTGPDGPAFVDISQASGIQSIWAPDPEGSPAHNSHHITQFADLDGDGFDEAIMHNFFNAVTSGAYPHLHFILHNNGDGTFADITDASGLHLVEAQAFAYGDVDNDGDLDVFTGAAYPSSTARNRMFLNDGHAVFTEVENSGIPRRAGCCYNTSAVFGDYNGDGNLDLFLGNGYSSQPTLDELLIGNGDGTFTDASDRLRGNVPRLSNAAVSCDYDEDGDQDIFVAMYGVSHLNGHNVLWENDGSGNFTNVAEERGFAYLRTGNYYLASTGNGRDEQPEDAPYVGSNGFALNCGDINEDGHLDIYAAAISHPQPSNNFSRRWSDPTALLVSRGPDAQWRFENEFLDRNLTFNEGDIDASMIDFDNDGRLDVTAQRDNGYERGYPDAIYQGWFGFHHQLADGTFENISFGAGINDVNDQTTYLSKGAGSHSWSDIDHDGDLDLLIGLHRISEITEAGRPNRLFRNDVGQSNDWLALRLVGDGEHVNRDAIGARVEVRLPESTLTRVIVSTRGTWTTADTRVVHVGLAERGCDYTVVVQWPDGTEASFEAQDIPRRRYVSIAYPDVLTIEP